MLIIFWGGGEIGIGIGNGGFKERMGDDGG